MQSSKQQIFRRPSYFESSISFGPQESKREVNNTSNDAVRSMCYLLVCAILGLSLAGCIPLPYRVHYDSQYVKPVPSGPDAICASCDRNIEDLGKERKTSGLGYALNYDTAGNALFGEDLTNAQCRIVPVSMLPEIQSPCPANKPYLCGAFCSAVRYPGCTP